MVPKYYTGIGSRDTPQDILNNMYGCAEKLATLGHTLRSGKAAGADTAFQLGAQSVNGASQIFVPWHGFGKDTKWNKLANNLDHSLDVLVPDFSKAELIAAQLHPAWSRLSQGAKKLHTRNVFQVLGHNCNTPSKFVLYYAPERNGKVSGGTATAVMLAREYNIPTINMLFMGWVNKLRDIIKGDQNGKTK